MVLPVFLLSACLGGGGSFDLDSVDTEAPRAAPKYQDVPSKKPEARKDQGGYGFAMRFKRRNWHPRANPKEDEVKLKNDDWEATGLPTELKELPLKQKSVISEVKTNGDSKMYTSPYLSQDADSSHANGANQPKNEVTDCSNLNYLKYGMLTRKNSESAMQAVKNSDQTAARTAQGAQSMFLQGERTDEKQIPKDENVVYLGSWYGYIANGTSWTGNASNETSGNRAEFTVNFDKKQITGKLTAENRSEATFTIDAMIDGNGFKGTAKTGNDGFAPDQNNSTVTHKVRIANAEVQGGFYGSNAEELGGWFAYPGNGQAKNATVESDNGNSASSATVVFGAKRQQLVK